MTFVSCRQNSSPLCYHANRPTIRKCNFTTTNLLKLQKRINQSIIAKFPSVFARTSPTTNWRDTITQSIRHRIVETLVGYILAIRPSYLLHSQVSLTIQQLESFWFQISPTELEYREEMERIISFAKQFSNSGNVQWEYKRDNTWEVFPDSLNNVIQTASEINSNSASVIQTNDAHYEISFQGETIGLLGSFSTLVMMEGSTGYCKNTGKLYSLRCVHQLVELSPDHLIAATTSQPIIQSNWLTNLGTHLLAVPPNSNEYCDVMHYFENSAGMSKFSIENVVRIENHKLWKHYQLHSKEKYIRKLWHGTSLNNAELIAYTGYQRYNKNIQFGQGNYFATNASYALNDNYSIPMDDGTKTILLNYVAVGRSIGKSHYHQEPAGLDSCVDNVIQPSSYVTFERESAYPAYIVHVKRI